MLTELNSICKTAERLAVVGDEVQIKSFNLEL